MKKLFLFLLLAQGFVLCANAQFTVYNFKTDIARLSHQRDSLMKLPANKKNILLIDSIGALIMYHADYTYHFNALKVAKDSIGVAWMRSYNIGRLRGMRYYPWYNVKNEQYLRAFKEQMYEDATRLLIEYERFHLSELHLIALPFFHSGICWELKKASIEAGGKWDRDYDCFVEDDGH